MRFLKFLILSLLLIVLLVISGLGVIMELPSLPGLNGIKKPTEMIVKAWAENSGLFFFFVTVFVLTLFYIVITIMSVRSKPVVTIDTDSGKVHIIDSAVRKYLLSALNKMPSIHVRSIHVSGSKKGLQVIVFVRVRSVSHLNDVKEIIVERIREALVTELGVPTVGKIEVIVDDFEASRAVKNAKLVAEKTPANTVAELPEEPLVETVESTEKTMPAAEEESVSAEETPSMKIETIPELQMLNIDELLAEKAEEDTKKDVDAPDDDAAK